MGLRKVTGFETSATIDRGVFWLHYKVTFWLLCVLATVIVSRQFFGSPIECEAKTHLLDNHCWNYRTFIADGLSQKSKRHASQEDNRSYVKGYQYYYLLLLLQACGFYLPRLVWRCLEGKLMEQLLWRLNHPYLHPEERTKKKKQLVRYFRDHMRRNAFYLFFYIVSELLCVVNSVVQLVLVNHFLDGVFNLFPGEVFGLVLSGSQHRTDPLSQTFSRTTWCRYEKPGSTKTLDVSCSLPHNAFNELVCVAVWYWTAVLVVLTVAALLLHVWELFSSRMRIFALKRRARLLDRACLEKVLLDAGLGDWFLLLLFCGNADPVHVNDVFRALAEDLGKSSLGNIMICYPTGQVVDQVQRTSAAV